MNVTSLPAAKDEEQQIIGSILLDPGLLSEVSRRLNPSDFADPCHQAAFTTLLSMNRASVPIDEVTLKHNLIASEAFTKLKYPSAAYISKTGLAVTTTAHLSYNCDRVAEAARKRRLYHIASVAAEDSLNSKASSEILCNLCADIEDLRREFVDDASGIKSVPLSEFITQDHKIEFLIEGVITAAQPGVIAARSKSQKTTIALDAAISIAYGCRFLGKYWVPKPQPCGIISAESGGATLAESFARIAASKGLSSSEIDNLHVSTTMPPLKTVEGREALEHWIEQHNLRCVFIDPTYKALPGVDDTQLSKMSEVLFPISDIIDRTNCTVIMVHHNRKTPAQQGKPYSEPTIEDIQGTGYQQWARFFLLLNKRREWDPTEGQHWLWFKTEGSAGFGSRYFLNVHEGRRTDPNGRVWQIELTDPGEGATREKDNQAAQREAEQMEADRRSVCDVLAKHHEGLTKTKVKDLSKVSGRRLPAVLEIMFDEGDIEKAKVPVSNHKTLHDGIKLSTTEIT